jgi:hypothetical protein
MLMGNPMDEQREKKLAELKTSVARGQYRVDPVAVADAIVRRLFEPPVPRPEPPETQKECSYPDSSPGASANVSWPGPSSTRPTHARSLVLAFSATLRALAGTQAQSS